MTEHERRSNRILVQTYCFSSPVRFKLWQFDLAPGVWRFFIVLTLLFAAGCGSLNEQYVEADRATFNVIASRYRAYIDNDPTLTELQKKNRKNTIDSWDARTTEAERFLKLGEFKDWQPPESSIWYGWERGLFGESKEE